jgi:hypothetical protein
MASAGSELHRVCRIGADQRERDRDDAASRAGAGTGNGDAVDSAPAVTMPINPLGTVLFPSLLPLHVFEPQHV